ncbi:hypothetical protein [Actinacidiphila reveromycinica]|uniref:hypothetical protein n=1 Tax=Actinacidiphila reveromycinica TaxID=659352 RepID=UPI001923D3B1|nr:hypothetical protein [Streptomyces sp. SN-593]
MYYVSVLAGLIFCVLVKEGIRLFRDILLLRRLERLMIDCSPLQRAKVGGLLAASLGAPEHARCRENDCTIEEINRGGIRGSSE